MEGAVSISESLVAACGSTIVDLTGKRPPCTVSLIEPRPLQGSLPLPSFSAFACGAVVGDQLLGRALAVGGSRSDAADAGPRYTPLHEAGMHLARAVPQSGDGGVPFCVMITRCDTGALQWAVRVPTSTTPGGEPLVVTHLQLLDAETVVFTAEAPGMPTGLYVGRRGDVPAASRRENRQMRQFIADARAVAVDGTQDDPIVALAPLLPHEVLVATQRGRLVRVRLGLGEPTAHSVGSGFDFLGAVHGAAAAPARRLALTCSPMEVGDDGAASGVQPGFAAWCIDGCVERKCAVVDLATGRCEPVVLDGGELVKRVDFLGRNFLLITCATLPPPAKRQSATQQPLWSHSLRFVQIRTPAESGRSAGSKRSKATPSFTLVNHSPVPFPSKTYEPVASAYVANTSVHLLFACRVGEAGGARLDSLVCAAIPLGDEPYSAEDLRSAAWRQSLPTVAVQLPTRSRGVNRVVALGMQEQDGEDDLVADYERRQERQAKQLTLHYALTDRAWATSSVACDGQASARVIIFEVTTAFHVHTRLAKQWHNAAVGLSHLLEQVAAGMCAVETGTTPATCRAWNPMHTRSALRRLSQEQLAAVFHHIAVALKPSRGDDVADASCPETHCRFGSLATCAVDLATHIVILAPQLGVAIAPADVEEVLLLLRAGRGSAHPLQRRVARMTMMLDAALQARMQQRLVERSVAGRSTRAGDDDTITAQNTILHVPALIQMQRQLHTRYVASHWAAEVSEGGEAVADLAMQLLRRAGFARNRLHDWHDTGRGSHSDAAFNAYELSITAAASQR